MAPPQFGLPEDGRAWPERPSAFGLALRGRRLALVEIGDPAEQVWLALPGGGLEPGESAEIALVREFAEETGLLVRPTGLVGESSDRVIINAGRAFNVRGRFFAVDFQNPDFAALAKVFGAYGEQVTQPGDLEAAIGRGFASGKPAVIDVIIDRNTLAPVVYRPE